MAIPPPEWAIGRLRWWMVGVLIGVAVGFGVAAWNDDTPWGWYTFWPIAVGAVACLVVGAWSTVKTNRVRQRLADLEREPATTYGDLAWRLWHRALVERRARFRFDTTAWMQQTGPDGPRIITMNVPLPARSTSDNLSEEVPIGADRQLGDRERHRRILQLTAFGAMLLFFAAGLALAPGPRPWGMFGAIATPLVFVIFAAYRLGLRPITFNLSSASPGLIRATRGLRTEEFTRNDSVLVVQRLRWGIVVRVFRTDGEWREFAFQGGTSDPAYAQLIARWCWRPETRSQSVTVWPAVSGTTPQEPVTLGHDEA
ncbi:MAG TPA: hypothetical protein PKE29_08335 [Phycisphaerales bacterium]|nr:hypothetical protein [Phycisphaerales bacterium]